MLTFRSRTGRDRARLGDGGVLLLVAALLVGFLQQEWREDGGGAGGGQVASHFVEVQLADREFVMFIDGKAIAESAGDGDKVAR